MIDIEIVLRLTIIAIGTDNLAVIDSHIYWTGVYYLAAR